MVEITEKGYIPDPQILHIKCNKCGTKFKTDEWFFLHEPRTVGKPSSKNGYIHVSCPLCNHFISIKARGS